LSQSPTLGGVRIAEFINADNGYLLMEKMEIRNVYANELIENQFDYSDVLAGTCGR
jgi:hypothetical protein